MKNFACLAVVLSALLFTGTYHPLSYLWIFVSRIQTVPPIRQKKVPLPLLNPTAKQSFGFKSFNLQIYFSWLRIKSRNVMLPEVILFAFNDARLKTSFKLFAILPEICALLEARLHCTNPDNQVGVAISNCHIFSIQKKNESGITQLFNFNVSSCISIEI